MLTKPHEPSILRAEIAELRTRLSEADEMIRAIRSGEADALLIESNAGPQVYTLEGEEAESNRLRAAMLAQVSDAVIAVDVDDRIVFLNTAAERLYDVAVTDALGRMRSFVYRLQWLNPEDEAVATAAERDLGRWRGEVVHVRRDGRALYVEKTLTILRDLAGQPTGKLAVIRDVTERKQQEAHSDLLMAEVNHRAKNLLAVVQAFSYQTLKHGDPATFVKRLSDRIDGLAAGQDLLVTNQWQGIEVEDVVISQLAHIKDLIRARVRIEGPPARLTAAAAQGIGMALHELATNATKYGALSNLEGQVDIAWQVTAADKPEFSISWVERGGPPVSKPGVKGFGCTVVERMAAEAVKGKAEISFRENGVSWNLSAPVGSTLE